MAIRITEDGIVNYENSPDVNRKLFPNLNICGKEIDELEEEINGKSPAILNTTTGSIASFDNGADDMPLKSCVVNIEPIQEGTGDPSPENVRPISGYTGCYISNSSQVYPLVQGSIGDNDGKDGTSITRIRTGYIPYNGETSLSFYCKNSKSAERIRRIYWYNSLKEFISSNAVAFPAPSLPYVYSNFTPPENTAYYRIVIHGSDSTDNISPDGRVLVVNPIITSINWETEAGTVYGGTLDVVSGKLLVDRALINIASLQFKLYSNTGNGDSFYAIISDKKVGNQTSICNCFNNLNGAFGSMGARLTGIYCDHFNLPRVYFRPPDSNTTTLEEFNEWINNNTTNLCYLLAEPIEYQLTPQEIRTLLGENNIWSDAGDISVDYPADTKTYIDDLSIKTVEVSGQTPVITAEENTRYICGEVTSLTFTPSEKGICDVRFTAASISTVLTLPETVKLPEWFDPTLLEANTTYEINVLDGIYGVVMSWA